MAKDLGNLNIEIDVNKKSVDDAFKGGGKAAGDELSASIKNAISGFASKIFGSAGGKLSRMAMGLQGGGEGGGGGLGFVGGGGSGRGGGSKLGMAGSIKSIITKVAVVIGVVALLGAAIGAVAKTLVGWGRELESTTRKLSSVNAVLAMQAAEMQVGQLMRDIKSADVLAPFLLESTRQLEDIKNQLRPIFDLVAIIKSIIMSEIMNRLSEVIRMASLLLQGVAFILTVLNILRDIYNLLQDVLGIFSVVTAGTPWGAASELLKYLMSPKLSPTQALQNFMDNFAQHRIEQTEALMSIVAELRNLNDSDEAEHINRYMGQVGIALTEDKWNPWKTVPPGGNP